MKSLNGKPLGSWSVRVYARRIDKIIPLTFSKLEYKQEFHDGVPAWVATAPVQLHGKEKTIKFVFVPVGSGHFRHSLSID